MLTFIQLTAAFSALTSLALAAPAPQVGTSLQKRGPQNFVLGRDHPLALAKREAVLRRRDTNYVQDYTTGGTVDFTHSDGSFSLNFDTTDDFVVGVGWNPGSNAPITHTGDFSVTSGLGTLSVYGWSTDPLVEYYVIEDSSGFTQTGTQKGTLTSDGSEYTVWENTRTNEPSIEGTSTFEQYISIRNSPRTSGTVTIQNHFDAWKGFGMDLGTLNFQVIAVESWNGAGSAQQDVSQGASSGGSSAAPSGGASAAPSGVASAAPSGVASAAPSGVASAAPSAGASGAPSGFASAAPSSVASAAPSVSSAADLTCPAD